MVVGYQGGGGIVVFEVICIFGVLCQFKYPKLCFDLVLWSVFRLQNILSFLGKSSSTSYFFYRASLRWASPEESGGGVVRCSPSVVVAVAAIFMSMPTATPVGLRSNAGGGRSTSRP